MHLLLVFYAAAAVAVTATPCGPGTYGPPSGGASCSPCPVGKHQDHQSTLADSTCTECTQNTYQPDRGATSCSVCPEGTYTFASGQVLCNVFNENDKNVTGAETALGEKGFGGSLMTVMPGGVLIVDKSVNITASKIVVAGTLRIAVKDRVQGRFAEGAFDDMRVSTGIIFWGATNKFDGVEKENYKDDTGTKNDSPPASFGTQPCRYVSPR